MGEEFNMEGILNSEELESLFIEEDDETNQDTSPEEKEEQEDNEETTEVDLNQPEGVSSEDEDNQDEEDTTSEKDSTSPNDNFYSSIAKALKEDGIFSDLEDERIEKTITPEDFASLVQEQLQAGLDEKQKRIDDALNLGIEPTVIQKYERTIDYLDSLSEDVIKDESEKGETLRKQLIFQDFINRGFSKEKATKEVQKSLNAGSDVEDALDSLQGNKDFFKKGYEDLINQAKEEEAEEIKQKQEEADKLKKSILEDDKVFKDFKVDKKTRTKVFENISKPVYKDPDSGEFYTAIQKYEKDNPIDFLKNVSLIYTLTNGFKDFDSFIKPKVREKMNKGISDLTNKLSNTARNSDGSLKFVTSSRNDKDQSYFGNGWTLDV